MCVPTICIVQIDYTESLSPVKALPFPGLNEGDNSMDEAIFSIPGILVFGLVEND